MLKYYNQNCGLNNNTRRNNMKRKQPTKMFIFFFLMNFIARIYTFGHNAVENKNRLLK